MGTVVMVVMVIGVALGCTDRVVVMVVVTGTVGR